MKSELLSGFTGKGGERWLPFLIWLKQINRHSLKADLLAELAGQAEQVADAPGPCSCRRRFFK
jgi:hypothetical protein